MLVITTDAQIHTTHGSNHVIYSCSSVVDKTLLIKGWVHMKLMIEIWTLRNNLQSFKNQPKNELVLHI